MEFASFPEQVSSAEGSAGAVICAKQWGASEEMEMRSKT